MRPAFATIFLLAAPALAADGTAGYLAQPALRGDRLVFHSGGDLWSATVPAEGTRAQAQRLTSAVGSEVRPVLSPDGTQVAFAGTLDGNLEAYVMPVSGGMPRRLTFHPDRDIPVAWTPDGSKVIIRSTRTHPMGVFELFTVPAAGGAPERMPFSEGSLASVNPANGDIAFTRWSNEGWYWKGYRGGTAPDIWVASKDYSSIRRATKTEENELFPMWIGGRIYFLSDSDGRMNIWSIAADGTGRTQHTHASGQDFDLRWASADTGGAPRIAYAQGGDLWIFDIATGKSRKLDIALTGDRLDERARLVSPAEHMSELALSPDGKRLAIVARGEVLVGPVGKPEPKVHQSWIQLPGRGASRESGVSWVDGETLLLRTDAGGDASIQTVDITELGKPGGDAGHTVAKSDRWIFDPRSSPDGKWIAYGDKSLRLLLVPLAGGEPRVIGSSAAGEITDYRFAPDGRWLSWVEPLTTGLGRIHLYDTLKSTDHCISDSMSDDRKPRWDPKGLYLYFESARAIDPVIDQFDLAFSTTDAWNVYAIPLAAAIPPPLPAAAAAAGLDLKEWATPVPAEAADEEGKGEKGDKGGKGEKTPKAVKSGGGEKGDKGAKADKGDKDSTDDQPTFRELEWEGMMRRAAKLPIEPGNFTQIEPVNGGLLLVRDPVRGVNADAGPPPKLGSRGGSLEFANLVAGETKPVVATPVSFIDVSDDKSAAVLVRATAEGESLELLALATLGTPAAAPEPIKLDALRVAVDARAEWNQIFDEAWRLQRDFFWKPDMGGIDWKSVRARYGALLPRIGTRAELNDLVGEMSGELGNSHSYIGGGDDYEKSTPVGVGLLGIDATATKDGFRIDRILPQLSDEDGHESPLSAAHLGVLEGDTIVAIDGIPTAGMGEPGQALLGKAGQRVSIALKAAKDGAVRVIEVTPIESEEPLRYLDWVASRAKLVQEKSGGRVGYMHLPDMDAQGLTAFVRSFYPQYDKEGMVIDERFNGGGYVSQMVLERLRRRSIASGIGREGAPERYPVRAPSGPMAAIINENAGSDGDIFPTGFRLYGLGPLVGVRTWGGVVGIRDDKPFLDGGRATQPEYAFWEPKLGYGLENHGVAPDIEVELTPADRVAGRDPQLERAIAEVLARIPKEAAPTPPTPNRTNSPVPPGAR